MNINVINKGLILMIIVFSFVWIFSSIDIANVNRQLNYQISYRIQLEKENDLLRARIRSYQRYLPDTEDKPFPEYIEWKIKSMAVKNNIDPNVAFAIAVCESSLNPYAKNKNSTAKGIYQFLDSTWKWIGANGEQYDPEESIRQFMIWYPKNPNWWKECLNKIN